MRSSIWNAESDAIALDHRLSASAAARRIGCPTAAVYRRRQRLRLANGERQTTSPHGTTARYAVGCRCDTCKTAWAGYMRKNVARLHDRAAGEGIPPVVKHGSKSTYKNWNCRCEPCVDAFRKAIVLDDEQRARAAAHARQRNRETLQQATRGGYEWTGPELETAARTDLTATQVAAMIGRSVNGVRNQRQRMRWGDVKKQRLAGLVDADTSAAPQPPTQRRLDDAVDARNDAVAG